MFPFSCIEKNWDFLLNISNIQAIKKGVSKVLIKRIHTQKANEWRKAFSSIPWLLNMCFGASSSDEVKIRKQVAWRGIMCFDREHRARAELSPERWAEVPNLLARYECAMFTSCWVFTAMNDAKQESLLQLLIPSQKVPAIGSPALWNLLVQSC